MSSRMILPGVAGAVLILTLFFAAVAGAQDTTTAQTAAPETTTSTADAALETTTAENNNARDADAFRCEFFLRAVRDDRGALKAQYRGDELVVQRFEQCVSGDVLRNTIPNRKLPFTGGMSLGGLAVIGLAFVVVGVALLRAVIRRAG